MTDFGTWIRATWPETMKASRLSERTDDLTNLIAQLWVVAKMVQEHRDVAIEFPMSPSNVLRTEPPSILLTKIIGPRADDALTACKEFMEKYS